MSGTVFTERINLLAMEKAEYCLMIHICIEFILRRLTVPIGCNAAFPATVGLTMILYKKYNNNNKLSRLRLSAPDFK